MENNESITETTTPNTEIKERDNNNINESNNESLTENNHNIETVTENNINTEGISENAIESPPLISNNDITGKKVYSEDKHVDDNISLNSRNDIETKSKSTTNKFPQSSLMESLPNQIIKDDVPKEAKETTTDFNFCDMFDNVEKSFNNSIKDDIEKVNSKFNNLGHTVKFKDFEGDFNNIDEKSTSTQITNVNINDPLSKNFDFPLKHNRIANIEDMRSSKNIIRIFHKSETIAENISNIENKERFKNRFNKPKQLGLSSIRKHSTFISDAHFLNKNRHDFFDESLKEEANSVNEKDLNDLHMNKSNSTPNLSTEDNLNELSDQRLKSFIKEKKAKKKDKLPITTFKKKPTKGNNISSSSLDLLLNKDHEDIGYIDKIMLQKMNNTSKERNIINSSEFERNKNKYSEERFYYPIEFTDNVEGRKLYYEYKIRKNMSTEPLIIHRRNLLFVICFLLTLFLLALLIYDYHSLLINEKNSIFFSWINAIYILHIIDISIALLAFIYSNESSKKVFTMFTILLGLFTIVLFILRFIFNWTTKNLIPVDYK
ncbi:hypothetical protein BCR32DRAFT_288929 [Anaeromyces robustus]|uniref:Uncharacterized protein n=1 Tax=Anaeromyces robustus TaxID=1754192 RepID=A0A1Y1XQH5_9FUNG|nr:hypothetical protein BCR32DRAFT_288929 [Anaeromyces robustus]|eukprot:ORX87992.1 hypothetical protein BCR32DRAFT_288929 [Anaeromyces robustus]